jgi:hypothetical protein
MKKLKGSTKKARADRLVPISVVEDAVDRGASKPEKQ